MKEHFEKAADRGLAGCHVCGRVAEVALGNCPRCNTKLELRKPNSIQKTVALMAAAAALYIPSHILPIMTVVEIGVVTPNTIISGMMTFWRTGAYPIAIVIFVASILIPILKIAALSWLCAAAAGWRRCRPWPWAAWPWEPLVMSRSGSSRHRSSWSSMAACSRPPPREPCEISASSMRLADPMRAASSSRWSRLRRAACR
jgi:hypothetical protein